MTDSIKVVGGTDDPDGPMTLNGFLIAGLIFIILVAGLIWMTSPLRNHDEAKTQSATLSRLDLIPARADVNYAYLSVDTVRGKITLLGYYYLGEVTVGADAKTSSVGAFYVCDGQTIWGEKVPDNTYIPKVRGDYIIPVPTKGCFS